MVFDRIACGVDASPESLEAVCQAERLLAPAGQLVVIGVADVALAVHAGWSAATFADQIESEERRALGEAIAAIRRRRGVESRLVKGQPVSSLLATAREERATLLAVGTHEHARTAGILLGSVATTVLHEAPCSVLVARRAGAPESFPRSVVVGLDGSNEARAAGEVAAGIAERFSVPIRSVVADGGKPVDVDGLRDVPALDWDERKPVDALVAASHDADLLVVGSRGLHGLAALGSVSERVAHEAACSVLVIREERN